MTENAWPAQLGAFVRVLQAALEEAKQERDDLEAQLAEAHKLLVEAAYVLSAYGRFHPLVNKRPSDLRAALKAFLASMEAQE